MELQVDKRRWLYRQPFWIKAIIFFLIFFLSRLLAEIVVRGLFEGTTILQASNKEIKRFFGKAISSSVVMAMIFSYWMGNPKTVKKPN